MDKYYTKQPSCTTPDGKEWFASGGGNKPMELDKSPCDTCFHREACEAWVRHCTTLYDDFSFSVEGCPYYASIPQSILYLCDGKMCGDDCPNIDCMHTSDIRHAKNFKKQSFTDEYWEEDDALVSYRVPSKEEWRERYCTNKQLSGIRKRMDGET